MIKIGGKEKYPFKDHVTSEAEGGESPPILSLQARLK